MNIERKEERIYSFVIEGTEHKGFRFESRWEGFLKYVNERRQFVIIAPEKPGLDVDKFLDGIAPGQTFSTTESFILVNCSPEFLPKQKSASNVSG
jgi:hypothetical protein